MVCESGATAAALHGGAVMALGDTLRDDGKHQPAGRRPHRDHRKQDEFLRGRAQGRRRARHCMPLHRGRTTIGGDAHYPQRRQAAAIVTQTQLIFDKAD